jgi:hypothetical protein
MGVPKLGLLLSQNFKHSYLFQIKFILKMWGQYLVALKKIFDMHSMPQSKLIWPLFSRGLWSGVKFPIWFPPFFFYHNSCKSCLNEQCEGILSIYASRPLGPIWCLFAFPTKALNIHNSSTNVTPKVGMHLGIIGFHPLHSPLHF